MSKLWKKEFSLKMISLLVTGMSILGCSHGYNRTVAHVDRDKFMRPWYVMAGRFTFLEKDVFNSVEKYTWNEEKQQIDIDFSYNQGSFTGKLKKYPQTGWIDNHETNATWTISPFWPLKFTYLIIAMDPNYEWTVIGVPSQNYLWIMASDPGISKVKLAEIIEHVKSINYSVKDIVYVEHQKK
ncbi:MAG: lipocalin family protein [Bacteriovoracaceae bacterium]|nr:lipocalin family protein [Bacteriovoracaceae bacterium]